MTHVFISYKHDDEDFVDVLRRKLLDVGLESWTDADIQPGEEWRPAIDNAVRNASAVVVVMTPDARASEYVTYEWSFAIGLDKTVVPIILKQTTLHPILEQRQFLDFTKARTRDWAALQKRLTGLKPKTVPVISHTEKSDGYRQQPKVSTHQTLIKDLDSELPKARESAASVLGELKAFDAIPKLIELLQDVVEEVRLAAAKALGKLGRDNAVPALMALANRVDLGSETQWAAVIALSDIGSRRAILFLYGKYLESPDDIGFQRSLIYAVGRHNVSSLKSTILDDLRELGLREYDGFKEEVVQLSNRLQDKVNMQQKLTPQERYRVKTDLEHIIASQATLVAFFESLKEFAIAKQLRHSDTSELVKLLESVQT